MSAENSIRLETALPKEVTQEIEKAKNLLVQSGEKTEIPAHGKCSGGKVNPGKLTLVDSYKVEGNTLLTSLKLTTVCPKSSPVHPPIFFEFDPRTNTWQERDKRRSNREPLDFSRLNFKGRGL